MASHQQMTVMYNTLPSFFLQAVPIIHTKLTTTETQDQKHMYHCLCHFEHCSMQRVQQKCFLLPSCCRSCIEVFSVALAQGIVASVSVTPCGLTYRSSQVKPSPSQFLMSIYNRAISASKLELLHGWMNSIKPCARSEVSLTFETLWGFQNSLIDLDVQLSWMVSIIAIQSLKSSSKAAYVMRGQTFWIDCRF